MSIIIALYCDGGVIRSNPSPIGGTYAWCHVNDQGEQVCCNSGFIPAYRGTREGLMTNNITEMAALVYGLEALPGDWEGTIYSDSWVTLQRIFHEAKCTGIPLWLMDRIGAVLRTHDMRRIQYQLLNGHPTRAQLLAGTGKTGLPVSKLNVWCDDECKAVARRIMQERAA